MNTAKRAHGFVPRPGLGTFHYPVGLPVGAPIRNRRGRTVLSCPHCRLDGDDSVAFKHRGAFRAHMESVHHITFTKGGTPDEVSQHTTG